jgi:hypothetical protein
MQNMEYNCGSSGVILFNKNKPNVVTKRTRGSSILREYKIHCLCYSVCSNNKKKYTLLQIPRPLSLINQRSYEMEKIEDNEMLGETDIDSVLWREVSDFKRELMRYNIEAFDYELYMQPNGSVSLIDFDKFKVFSS